MKIGRNGIIAAALITVLALAGSAALAGNPDDGDPGADQEQSARVTMGFRIAPVQLNLNGRDRKLVGLGSYLVNAIGGCNDCHTRPSYVTGHDPSLGQPEQINADQYLTGGRQFGPFTSANITPDENGHPAGLTLAQFKNVLRTGQDPDQPGRLLQVMPWPVYGKMTDRDMRAIYEFLSAIPSRPDNPNPGP